MSSPPAVVANATTVSTADILTEFVNLIDKDVEYTLKELKDIMSDVYKTKKCPKKVAPVKKVTVKSDSSSDDDEKPKKRGRPSKTKLDKDGNEKVKRRPSAYNLFVKQTIMKLKKEQPDTPAKELLGMSAVLWKELSKEEKDAYKETDTTEE